MEGHVSRGAGEDGAPLAQRHRDPSADDATSFAPQPQPHPARAAQAPLPPDPLAEVFW
jgi:hypothetical protein